MFAMTVTFQRFPKDRIIVATFAQPFAGEDVRLANQETAKFIAEVGAPVFRIENTSSDLSFGDVTDGLAFAARSGDEGSARDPNAQFLFVGMGPVIEMTAKSFAQPQYAGREVPLFKTLDDALAYARSKR
jgi:hypothetical protein